MIDFALEAGDLDITFVFTIATTLVAAALLAWILISDPRAPS